MTTAKHLLLVAIALSSVFAGTALAQQPVQTKRGSAAWTTAALTECPEQQIAERPDVQKARLTARPATPEERARIVRFLTTRGPAGPDPDNQFAMSPAEAHAFRSGKTVMSHDAKHGTQVSYASTDGRIFLWYPGEDRMWIGRWTACVGRFTMSATPNAPTRPLHPSIPRFSEPVYITFGQICFQYDPKRRWACQPAGYLRKTHVESKTGDIFKLEGRSKPPFNLAKDKTTFSALLKRR